MYGIAVIVIILLLIFFAVAIYKSTDTANNSTVNNNSTPAAGNNSSAGPKNNSSNNTANNTTNNTVIANQSAGGGGGRGSSGSATEYTVSFNTTAAGGSPASYDTATALSGSPITLPSLIPDHANSTLAFAGWYTSLDETAEVWDNIKPVTKNMTLYARWEAEVVYDPNAANIKFGPAPAPAENPETMELLTGASVTLTPQSSAFSNITAGGYRLLGWNKSSAGGTVADYPPNGAVSNLDNNMTLYAIWDYPATVTFNASGLGYFDNNISKTAKEIGYNISASNGTIPAPENLNLVLTDGSHLLGWSKTQSSNPDFFFNTTAVDGDITVYAITAVNPVVSFHIGDQNISVMTNAEDGKTVTIIQEIEDAITGFDAGPFNGWYDAETGGTLISSNNSTGEEITNDTIVPANLYARFTVTVTYDNNIGNRIDIEALHTGDSYTIQTPGDSVFTRTGYTLQGWSTSSTGGTEYTDSDQIVLKSNMTFYAVWNPNAYTLTFNAGESGSVNPASKGAVYGSAVNTLPTPTRTGYTLEGWYTEINGGGTKYESATVYNTASDTTLYANWTANQYTVSFDIQGATGTEPAPVPVAYDDVISGLPDDGGFTKDGYVFGGWYTEINGNGTKYETTTPYTIADNTTLYAKWNAQIYIVDDTGSPVIVTSTDAENKVYDLTSLDLERANVTKLAGWSLTADAVNSSVLQADTAYNATTHYLTFTTAPTPKSTYYTRWNAEYKYDPGDHSVVSLGITIERLTNNTYNVAGVESNNVESGYAYIWQKGTDGHAYHNANAYGALPSIYFTQNLTLTSQYLSAEDQSSEMWLVFFDANGGSELPDPQVQTSAGGTIAQGDYPEPTRTGYTFSGWGDSPNSVSPISGLEKENAGTHQFTTNQVLYAVWSPN